MRRLTPRLATLALLLCGIAGAGRAAPWTVRSQLLTSEYTKRSTDSSISGISFLELSAEQGIDLAFEYRPRRAVGWELAVGQLAIDASPGFSRLVAVSFDPLVLEERVTLGDRGTIALRPLTGALLFHLPAGRHLDLHVGPLLGVALFDVDGGLPDRDPELAYGGKLGAEVRLGQGPWALSAELRHLQIVHEGVERDLYRDMGLQTVGFGVTYRLGD
jgi:hypothetical protein